MKVCHFTSAHGSMDARIFYKECVFLAKAGFDVTLVAQGESREEKGVKVVGCKEPGNRLKRMFFFAKKVYKEALKQNADLYHFHDPELLPYGVKLAKKGKKVVFDSHENAPAQIAEKSYIPKFLRKAVRNLYFAYETRCIKKLDAVVVPCTFDGKNIFENRAKRTVYIANYPVLEEFSSAEYDESLSSDICFVGNLSIDSGISTLIHACKKANAKLLLAGYYRDNIRAEAENSNAITLDCVDRQTVSTILRSSKIGAILYHDVGQYYHIDTFAVKAYEFMLSSLPLLSCKNPYFEKIINEYHLGLCVDPEDENAVADAITYLLSHPEECAEMGKNGRHLVETVFNFNEESKKLVALYHDLLGETK